MRNILLLFIFIFCISLDLGSKYYFENSFTKDYCISQESKSYAHSNAFGGISPEYFCAYGDEKILQGYRNEAKVSLIGDFLELKLSYNSGIAFSLPIHGIVLQILTVILILTIIHHYIKEEFKKNSRILDLGYTFILAGAIPHAYERIFYGYVVDFISVKYFAILNFADIFISLGVFFLIVYYFKYEYARKY